MKHNEPFGMALTEAMAYLVRVSQYLLIMWRYQR